MKMLQQCWLTLFVLCVALEVQCYLPSSATTRWCTPTNSNKQRCRSLQDLLSTGHHSPVNPGLSANRIILLFASLSSDDMVNSDDDFLSKQYKEEDIVASMDDLNAMTRSGADNAVATNDTCKDGTGANLLLQIGLGSVFALFVYLALTMAWSVTMDFASSASLGLGNEVVGELGNLGANIWTLLVAIIMGLWEVLKVVVPFIGKGLMDAGKAAAPVVGEASTRFTEAATPYVQEAARVVNDAAAPYVDTVTNAVDTSIVAPVKNGIQDVQMSVTSQIDSTLNSVTSTVQGVTNDATNTVRGAVDAQTAKLLSPFQDITQKVIDPAASNDFIDTVEDVAKPIQDVGEVTNTMK